MTERPILFSGEMVRAILDGRKTQTRRVAAKLNPLYLDQHCDPLKAGREAKVNREAAANMWCPFGKVGDRLYVREAFVLPHRYDRVPALTLEADERQLVRYLASNGAKENYGRYRPGMHLPKWASRISLEITGTRLERLQEISEDDAKAEGLKQLSKDGLLYKWGIPEADGLSGEEKGSRWQDFHHDPRQAFRVRWNLLNEKRDFGWDVNPWVWVIEFRPVEQPEIPSSSTQVSVPDQPKKESE